MNKNFLIALLQDYNFNDIDIIDNSNKILEGIKSAFGSPGGKFFVAGKLISLFPEHTRYVEPFIGGGSVLFRKKKESQEFINDKDEEIITCFNFMQNLNEQQLEALKKMDWKTSKENFNKLLTEYKESPTNKDPVYQFYRYVYIKAASDAGEMRSYDDRAEGEVMKLTERLMKIKERLSGVKIENMDYKDFVKKYSIAESFTFLDPPYPSARMNWKWCPTQEEFEPFTKTIPGKWMITYEVCDGWKEAKYNHKLLSQYNLAAPSEGTMKRKNELVVTNYLIKENTLYLESTIDPEEAKEIIEYFSLSNLSFKESEYKLSNEFKKILNLYASKRRGDTIQQSFEQLKNSFKNYLSKLIKEGRDNFYPEKMPAFTLELFDKYTDYGYSVPQPDGIIKEFKTLKELKNSGIDYRGYKFHINMKEAEKKIGDFVYVKQWWKNKYAENKPIENFIISTNMNIDFCLDNNLLIDNFKESNFYIVPSDKNMTYLSESIIFVPENSKMNLTSHPSWIKKIDEGKISILESTELEKILEFSGKKLSGKFRASRNDENSDFWRLEKYE